MNFIKWEKEVELTLAPVLSDKSKRQMFVKLLTKKIENLWTGKVVTSKSAAEQNRFRSPYIEVRNRIGGSDLLFRIGYKETKTRYLHSPADPTHIVVELSMNQRAQFKPEDFEELNLVALEATGVAEALYKDK